MSKLLTAKQLGEIRKRHELTVKADRCGWISAHKDRHSLIEHIDALQGEQRKTLGDFQHAHRKFVIKMGWDNSKTPLEAVALIHEEAAELGHELRQGNIDRHKVGFELADLILRTVDLAGELGIDITSSTAAKIEYNIKNIATHKAKGRRL